MAYSDYGGYAYRNGDRVEERSDAFITGDGIKGTPGIWPGFIHAEGRSGGSYHALLGDGPVLVGLYKQSCYEILHSGGKSSVQECAGLSEEIYLIEAYCDKEPMSFEIDGSKVELVWRETDNYYVFCRLTHPDGTVWTGFSGYGVGAGLEDADYGFSTDECVDMLADIFPSISQE